jgi:ribosomal protein S6--L-glutamate ligase
MHLTILSRGTGVHTTRRLVEASRQLGHRVRVLEPSRVQMGLGVGAAGLFLEHRPLGRTDVVIPRIAPSVHVYGLALVNQFDLAGTAVLNDAQSIANVRNKMRLMQLLTREGILVPKTVMGRGALELRAMAALVGGVPVVVKLVQDPESFGVIVCESEQSLEAALETVLSMGHNLMVQRYVKPGEGRDLRALIVGGEVVAAVRRQAAGGKVRRSLLSGARFTAAKLSKDEARIAVDAARVVGLEVAAVDLLDLRHGPPRVFDVHSSPGLRELEDATGDDLAVPIVERAVALARERRAVVTLESRAERRGAAGRR